MNVYAFQAALYCEPCAIVIRADLNRRFSDAGAAPGADDGNAERYPQGPYSGGGGEADCPQHCDDCGAFLENPLTSDGRDYVREKLAGRPSPATEQWREFYRGTL